jgi:4-hydroxybenzoate polyprenyltransferase
MFFKNSGQDVQKTAQNFLDTLFLLRIPLLAPVWTILILGWITGSEHLHPGGSFFNGAIGAELPLWTILIGFSLIVVSIYVVNQIVDIESDRINHKLFLLPRGIISVNKAWILASACALFGIACAFFFDRVIIVLFIASLILGILYNLPPARLKNHAVGGVIANALGHGMLTFLVGWYISKYGSVVDFHTFKSGFLSSIAPSLANGAVFLATTIPDASGDSRTGKKTFCVNYGQKATAVAAAVMCSGALIFSFVMENHFWVMTIPTAISLFFFLRLVTATNQDLAFKSFKWPVFLLSAFVTLFMPLYGVLILVTFFGSRAYYRRRFGIEYPTFKSK